MKPTYQTNKSAGADIASCETVTINPNQIKLVSTGYTLTNNDVNGVGAIFLFARSSLAYKKGLLLANGVGLIDIDYRDEIKVMLLNTTEQAVTIEKGERIAQLVPVSVLGVKQMSFPVLNQDRVGGFGSTGLQGVK